MLLLIILLSLHDPSTRFLSMLISLLLGAHDFLHLEFIRNVDSFLHSRTCFNSFHPSFNRRERLDLNTSPRTEVDPRETGDICNTELVADKPETLTSLLLLSKTVVQDLVKTLGLGLVAVDAVLDLLRSVSVEVIGLSLMIGKHTDDFLHI